MKDTSLKVGGREVKPSNSVSEEKDPNSPQEEVQNHCSEQQPSQARGHVSNIQPGGHPSQVSPRAPMSAFDSAFIEPSNRNPTFETSLEMDQQVVATDAASPPELQVVAANNAANANPMPPPDPVPYQEVYLNPNEPVVHGFSYATINYNGTTFFAPCNTYPETYSLAENSISPSAANSISPSVLNNNDGEINSDSLEQASNVKTQMNVTPNGYGFSYATINYNGTTFFTPCNTYPETYSLAENSISPSAANSISPSVLNNNDGEINSDSLEQASNVKATQMNVTPNGYEGAVGLSRGEVKTRLREQIEHYFSRGNLANDEYLVSQMDSDGYVSISTIVQFNLVKKYTSDVNLVSESLKDSKLVQLDEKGEKVRANPRSGVLILREIPESTPIQELEELFDGENCPKFSSCEFAHNNSWYVLFDSDEDTQRAYQYLREENKQFRGNPVMARIKAKAITNAPFTSQRNSSNTQEQDSYAAQNINPPQNPIQFAYANVPNDYSNQAICTPFYPPTMLQAWAPNTPPCVDLSTVLSVNGLSPQAAFRPLNNNSNRHSYAPRDRPVKAYTTQNYFSRSEQSRFLNRGQSTSYLQRQQLHQQAASFPNIVNSNSFDYMGYPASRSRNLPNFGADVNTFFTAPNLYYGKVPALYPAIPSQTRHTPVMISGRQMGINTINCQDPSYVAVGNSNSLPYSKESGVAGSGGKQGADSQVKENWVPNQRQPRKKWWKENGNTGAPRNYSENSSSSYSKQNNENEVKPESPKFDLETTSFPPLPGSMDTTEVIDVDCYERCLSDIVKGVKPSTRDTKTQTSESALVCSTKDSSTITIEDAIIPSDGAFTPPASPENLTETISTNEPVESSQDVGDWEDYAESPVESALCNTSVNSINAVPEAPAAFGASNSPAFHPVSTTNSMVNGSVTTAECAQSVPSTQPETEPNVPNDIPERPAVKMPKTKPLDSLPKGSRSPCDLPSPKNNNKALDAPKNKYDSRPVVSKQRSSFSCSKTSDSSSCSKDRANDFVSANTKSQDHCALKNSDTFLIKEKPVQGHKNKVTDTHKGRCTEGEPAQLSVNGHADSGESTVSSEDEKQQQQKKNLTYSEVARRGKEIMAKINQEQIEKDRQDAIVRQHKQQDTVAQSRWPFQRGPEKPNSRPPPRI